MQRVFRGHPAGARTRAGAERSKGGIGGGGKNPCGGITRIVREAFFLGFLEFVCPLLANFQETVGTLTKLTKLTIQPIRAKVPLLCQ